MISILSPAKTLDYDTKLPTERYSQPDFLEDSKELLGVLKDYDVDDIGKLMSISEKLSVLNHERYHSFEFPFTTDNARPAMYAFKGDVYRDLELSEYSDDDVEFMQNHVRILSGLYGILRPLDLMQPYRLEMGTKLQNDRGTNLYQFWGSKIAETLNDVFDEQDDNILLNLASDEYFSAVDTASLKGKVVKVNFLDYKKDRYKIVSFYAKRARGMMANYIIRNHIDDTESLKAFDVAGYYFSEERSSNDELTFLRDEV